MIHLVYVSHAVKKMDERALIDLLHQSRENNKRKGITGMLLYMGGNFMQVLDGEAAVVDDLYQRIVADERNSESTLLLREEINKRTFPGWSMGFRTLRGDEPELEGYTDFLDTALSPDQFAGADVAWGLLRRFRDSNR